MKKFTLLIISLLICLNLSGCVGMFYLAGKAAGTTANYFTP